MPGNKSEFLKFLAPVQVSISFIHPQIALALCGLVADDQYSDLKQCHVAACVSYSFLTGSCTFPLPVLKRHCP